MASTCCWLGPHSFHDEMLPSADEKVDDPKRPNWPEPPPAPANVSDDDAEAEAEASRDEDDADDDAYERANEEAAVPL